MAERIGGMRLNIDKMRHQRDRQQVCGAWYSPGPNAETEVCRKPATHLDRHDWPSLPDDPIRAGAALQRSTAVIAGQQIGAMLRKLGSTHNARRPTGS